MEALGEALGVRVETVIASLREPSDFCGLPVLVDGTMHLAPPGWAVRLREAGRGILFLDEISTAPPAVQSALLRVALDKVVGDLELPQEIMIVAAANPPDRFHGWELTPQLANRFIHLEWKPTIKDWCEGMISGWKQPRVRRLPEDWAKAIPAARTSISTFVHRRPELGEKIPREASEAGRAWPSGRSWDIAAFCEAACKSVQADEEVYATLLAGCVGAGPAMEYINWIENLDLPDPRDLLRAPNKAELPREDDRLFAVLNAVVAEALVKLTRKKWEAAWKIMGRAAKAGKTDLAAVAVGSLVRGREGDLGVPEEIEYFLPIMKTAKVI